VPEIHYDNPELKIGYIENVKIRYYMTKSLQPNELGILTLGSGKLTLFAAFKTIQINNIFVELF
jgi:hypothetical protein